MRLIDNSIALRPASVLDTEFACSVHHTALRDVVMRQFGDWEAIAQDKYFADSWVPRLFEIILFEGDECGYLRIEAEAKQLTIHELNLHPDYQNRGIGSRILRDVLATANESRIPVDLQVLHENQAAMLYRKLGFAEVGRNGTHIKMQYVP